MARGEGGEEEAKGDAGRGGSGSRKRKGGSGSRRGGSAESRRVRARARGGLLQVADELAVAGVVAAVGQRPLKRLEVGVEDLRAAICSEKRVRRLGKGESLSRIRVCLHDVGSSTQETEAILADSESAWRRYFSTGAGVGWGGRAEGSCAGETHEEGESDRLCGQKSARRSVCARFRKCECTCACVRARARVCVSVRA
eukprot:610107-Pleurochrysis_carterae.AAC.2